MGSSFWHFPLSKIDDPKCQEFWQSLLHTLSEILFGVHSGQGKGLAVSCLPTRDRVLYVVQENVQYLILRRRSSEIDLSLLDQRMGNI